MGKRLEMIPVTKPFMPPQHEYREKIRAIWELGWLTNHGPMVTELELQLKRHLDLTRLLYVSNGTVALQLALQALAMQGDVITTPFSYVATTSSIVWGGATPVMVDIRNDTLNIDPDQIEAAITKKTTAILAVHVYGNACDIERLEEIARKHQLSLILGSHRVAC